MADRFRTLGEELRSWPDDRVTALLVARPDLLAPIPQDFAALAARAAYPGSAARALDMLSRPTLQVAEAFCLLGDPTDLAELRVHLGGADPAGALQELRDLALLWGPEDAMHIVGAVRGTLPDSAGLGQSVAEMLRSRPDRHLTTLLANLGLTPAANPIPRSAGSPALGPAASSLVRAFEDDAWLDGVIADLPPEARAVLDRLASGQPWGQVEHATRVVDIAKVRSPIDDVLARGLLLPMDNETVVLPREVGLRLRGGAAFPDWTDAAPTPEVTLRPVKEVDRAAAGAAFTATRQLEELLDYWDEAPPATLRTGGLGVRELRRLANQLDVDEATVALLAEVAAAASLLANSGGADRTWLPTKAYDTWRLQAPGMRWATLASAWLGLHRVPGLVGTRDRDRVLGLLSADLDYAEAEPARRAVLLALADLGDGAAPDPGQLAEALDWRAPRQFGRLGRALFDWTVREAELLGLTGRGALARFAQTLLDADESALARPEAAAAIAPLLPQPLDHILLQADLTAVAPGPLTPELASILNVAADVESRGAATVYRFSESSMRRALDIGMSAAEIHAWLAASSKTPVPQPLTYLVDDVSRRHGRIRVGTAGAYLRCDDESLLSELMAGRTADELGLRRLAPTVVVSPLSPDELVKQLRTAGAAPVLEGPRGEVVLRRREARRAPTPRLTRLTGQPPPPPPTLLATAVRALRAGDRVRASGRPGRLPDMPGQPDDFEPAYAPPAELRRTSSAETLTMLRNAARDGSHIWIGYVNAEGSGSVRLIEPTQVSGGFVFAYDSLREEARTFAVHRITGVALPGADTTETAVPS